jgi:hypothetical protein
VYNGSRNVNIKSPGILAREYFSFFKKMAYDWLERKSASRLINIGTRKDQVYICFVKDPKERLRRNGGGTGNTITIKDLAEKWQRSGGRTGNYFSASRRVYKQDCASISNACCGVEGDPMVEMTWLGYFTRKPTRFGRIEIYFSFLLTITEL